MTPAPLDERNRRTAGRIVGAVMVFHGLLLVLAMLVLNHAMQPPVHPMPRQVSAPSSALPWAAAAAQPSPRAEQGGALPDWVRQAQRQDTAAPWQVDAQGHVQWREQQARP